MIVIDHQTFYPSIPRYIQPLYALEVAILGVKDVVRAQPAIDLYIKTRYGEVIATSRLALDGDAYCVVFKTWQQTSRLISDPFTAFDSRFRICHSIAQTAPALLYVLNTSGLPYTPRPSDSSNAFLRQLQAQFDLLQQKVDTGAHAFDTLVSQQDFRACKQPCLKASIAIASRMGKGPYFAFPFLSFP